MRSLTSRRLYKIAHQATPYSKEPTTRMFIDRSKAQYWKFGIFSPKVCWRRPRPRTKVSMPFSSSVPRWTVQFQNSPRFPRHRSTLRPGLIIETRHLGKFYFGTSGKNWAGIDTQQRALPLLGGNGSILSLRLLRRQWGGRTWECGSAWRCVRLCLGSPLYPPR